MLRYSRYNIVILMAATAWLMMAFSSCIVCGFDSYTVLFMCLQRNFICGHLKSTVYESNPQTTQEMKDNTSHAVAAIKITMLYRLCLNTIRRAQLCIDAAGNHFQHLLWRYILWSFDYCNNFCIYSMLRIRATFSWPILYNRNVWWAKQIVNLKKYMSSTVAFMELPISFHEDSHYEHSPSSHFSFPLSPV